MCVFICIARKHASSHTKEKRRRHMSMLPGRRGTWTLLAMGCSMIVDITVAKTGLLLKADLQAEVKAQAQLFPALTAVARGYLVNKRFMKSFRGNECFNATKGNAKGRQFCLSEDTPYLFPLKKDWHQSIKFALPSPCNATYRVPIACDTLLDGMGHSLVRMLSCAVRLRKVPHYSSCTSPLSTSLTKHMVLP